MITLNSSRQDYLQAVYRLSLKRGYTTNKEISAYLRISKASVSEMIRKLVADGKLKLQKNNISLSTEGEKEAKTVLSKHRIWEYFLVEVLKMEHGSVHEQADLLEHVTSDALRDALNKYLGYPTLSPNGKFIYENMEEVRETMRSL